MSVKVKICGLRTPETLDAALDAGADYFGLVFYAPSPRSIGVEDARALAARGRGRAESVALLVEPDDGRVEEIMTQVSPDLIQLHGAETPERVSAIRALSGLPIIKAVKISGRGDVEAARVYADAADMILYDARPDANAVKPLPGGNGVAFDWRLLGNIRDREAFALSGGLDPENVAAAVAVSGAAVVDVSSGVERAPGEKDVDLIRRFIAAARSADVAA